jgi:hypothetical protein
VTKIVRRRLTSLEELDTIEAKKASNSTLVTVTTIEPTPNFDFTDVDFFTLGFKFPIDSTKAFISSSLSS